MRIAKVLLELLVKVGKRLRPAFLTFFNFVKLFFQARSVLDIKDVAEILDQKIGHNQTDLRGEELASSLLHILALLNCAEDRCVCGGTTDSTLFQFFYQRSLVVTRRRLGEVLLGL